MGGIDDIIATRRPGRCCARRGADFQGAAADGFNHKGVHATVNVRFIALGFQIGKAHRDFAVFIAAGNGCREAGQGRGVIDCRYSHRRLNRSRGFSAVIVFSHRCKGIQGAVGIGRRCPVGLMGGVNDIIAARRPGHCCTRRGADFQGAAADGFNHKGVHGAVNVRFIALG